ncbi:MAG: YraN family protein [Gammaproteobacteria bacterium]|nr:YraN family protein [Gammaproteobacteria bacterium]
MKLFGKTSREQGDIAEEQARRHLEGQGLRTVARNFQSRFGELDLIMREQQTLVFVEVRYRRSPHFGGALASIDAKKQRRLIATAHGYLQQHPHNGPCRFDVIAISAAPNEIEWLQDAFGLSE